MKAQISRGQLPQSLLDGILSLASCFYSFAVSDKRKLFVYIQEAVGIVGDKLSVQYTLIFLLFL